MAEFKKLSDVEIIETPIDTANVLIEENGVIKRVPKDEVGGIKVAAAEVGQTIVVKAVDEAGKPAEWECVDKGASSWNELKGRPFYEEILKNQTLYEGIISGDEWTKIDEIPLIVGFSYFVIINGTEYNVECFDDGEGTPIIGSMSLWWEDDYIETEPPFCCGNNHFYTLLEGESQVKIVGDKQLIKQIDEKYIPYKAKRVYSLRDYITPEPIPNANLINKPLLVAEDVTIEQWNNFYKTMQEAFILNNNCDCVEIACRREWKITWFYEVDGGIEFDAFAIEHNGDTEELAKLRFIISYNEETQGIYQTFTVIKLFNIPWTYDSTQ